MREYTTLEIIKQLFENKKLKFVGKGATGSNVFATIEEIREIDSLAWTVEKDPSEDFQLTEFVYNMKWTKIKEPVDFMTAVNSGKRIRCGDSGAFRKIDTLLLCYSKIYTEEAIKELLNSKEWYVEEE